jgi:hypothetical protein
MRRYLTKYNKNVWLFEDLFKKLDLRPDLTEILFVEQGGTKRLGVEGGPDIDRDCRPKNYF